MKLSMILPVVLVAQPAAAEPLCPFLKRAVALAKQGDKLSALVAAAPSLDRFVCKADQRSDSTSYNCRLEIPLDGAEPFQGASIYNVVPACLPGFVPAQFGGLESADLPFVTINYADVASSIPTPHKTFTLQISYFRPQ